MSVHSLVLKAQHHIGLVLIAAGAFVVIVAIVIFILRRRPRDLDHAKYKQRWVELQKLCASKTTWPTAILEADKLLDDVLKRRKYKGKTMGERLVSAQRDLTSNETIWFGHKLRNKLVHEDYKLTRKNEVKSALLGYWQALKDLGALKNGK